MRTLIITAVSLLAFACTNDNNCTPEGYLNTWITNKTIVVTYDSTYQRNNYIIENGNNLVFEYNHSGAECQNIYDDEWGEKLIFEIPAGVNNFEYIDSAIITTNCFYQEYGAWVSHVPREITTGTLKGEKRNNNTWKITANVKSIEDLTQQEKTITFTENFEL